MSRASQRSTYRPARSSFVPAACCKKLEPECTQIFGFTEIGQAPIIGMSALLKLAEWWESRVNLAQGGVSCPDKEVCLSPPRLAAKGVVPLDQLWILLAPERRQQALRILAGVVARQLVPLPRKEADDECQAS